MRKYYAFAFLKWNFFVSIEGVNREFWLNINLVPGDDGLHYWNIDKECQSFTLSTDCSYHNHDVRIKLFRWDLWLYLFPVSGELCRLLQLLKFLHTIQKSVWRESRLYWSCTFFIMIRTLKATYICSVEKSTCVYKEKTCFSWNYICRTWVD